MTTVVYHNGILAADSLATVKLLDKDKPEIGYACRHCGKPMSGHRTACKIHLFKSPHFFRFEKILAAAGAGPAAEIERHMKIISNTGDYWTALKHYSMFGNAAFDLSMILVTDKSVYELFTYKETKDNTGFLEPSVREIGKNGTTAIGSGWQNAITAITAYNETATRAIYIASLVDKENTGGDVVNYVDFNNPKPEIKAITMQELKNIKLKK